MANKYLTTTRHHICALLNKPRILWDKYLGYGYPKFSDREKSLLYQCRDPYLRYQYRERLVDFYRIIKTYSLKVFQRTVVDLGSGHMVFFQVCQKLSAPKKMIGIERDPVLINIGRLKGYCMIEADINQS